MNLVSFSKPAALLASGGALIGLLLNQPAHTHSIAQAGLVAGFLHPLSDGDQLLLPLAVAVAGSASSGQLLLWGLAGGLAARALTANPKSYRGAAALIERHRGGDLAGGTGIIQA
jgi:hydrogenase/urease accessory protein HupE